MRVGLAIAREYGQPASWWVGLERSEQALLLADYRMRGREIEQARAAAARNRRRR